MSWLMCRFENCATTAVPVAELVRRRAHLPRLDPADLRHDLDAVIDASL
jgi:hypothetical protein